MNTTVQIGAEHLAAKASNPWKIVVVTWLAVSFLPLDYAAGWRRVSGVTKHGVVSAHVCLPEWPCNYGPLAALIRRFPDFPSDPAQGPKA